MSKNYFILICLLICICKITSDETPSTDNTKDNKDVKVEDTKATPKDKKKDEFVSKEEIDRILKESGLYGKETLTKEDYKKFFNQFLKTGDSAKSANFGMKESLVMDKMVDAMMDGVPDEFNIKDLDKYFTQKRFLAGISKMIGVDFNALVDAEKKKKEQTDQEAGKEKIKEFLDNRKRHAETVPGQGTDPDGDNDMQNDL